MYWITVEKCKLKTWRGKKVPLSIYVRLHYPTGSKIWFYLIGPNIQKWIRTNM